MTLRRVPRALLAISTVALVAPRLRKHRKDEPTRSLPSRDAHPFHDHMFL